MLYCTIDDLKKRLNEKLIIQLADYKKSNPATLAEANEEVLAVVEQAIISAGEEIDTYLRQRYTETQLTPTPAEIKRISEEISIFNLYVLKDFGKVPAVWDKKHDQAIELLKLIGTGKIKLNLGYDDAPAATKPSASEYQGGDQMFTNDSLRNL